MNGFSHRRFAGKTDGHPLLTTGFNAGFRVDSLIFPRQGLLGEVPPLEDNHSLTGGVFKLHSLIIL